MRCQRFCRRGGVDFCALLESTYAFIVFIAVVALLVWLCVWGYQKANEPPIQTSFRDSLLYANGKVLQVRNTGSAPLGCRVEMVNVRGDQHQSYAFRVDPGERQEIGILECSWNFERNESVTLHTTGYTTLNFTVP